MPSLSSVVVEESDVTNKLYGIIAGVPVPFPLPDDDACKLGVTCPVPAKKMVQEKVIIPVQKSYPIVSFVGHSLLPQVFGGGERNTWFTGY